MEGGFFSDMAIYATPPDGETKPLRLIQLPAGHSYQ
jgi:hypothetical protein